MGRYDILYSSSRFIIIHKEQTEHNADCITKKEMLTYDSNAKRPIEKQVEFGNPACSVIFEYDDINICGTKIKIKDRTMQVIFVKDQLPLEVVGNTADIENLVKEYIENPDEEHKNALLKCVQKLSVSLSKGEQ